MSKNKSDFFDMIKYNSTLTCISEMIIIRHLIGSSETCRKYLGECMNADMFLEAAYRETFESVHIAQLLEKNDMETFAKIYSLRGDYMLNADMNHDIIVFMKKMQELGGSLDHTIFRYSDILSTPLGTKYMEDYFKGYKKMAETFYDVGVCINVSRWIRKTCLTIKQL